MLDLDRDPVPGDPFEVKELARKLGDFADDVASALRSVKGLNGDTAVQEWAGLSGDAYRSQFGELPGRLDKLERSYRLASGALDDYWPKLETAQADADRALAQGRTARQELDSAQSQLTNADAWVKRAQDKSKSYQDDPKPNVPPPSAEEVRAAARNATDAQSAHTTASTAVHNAQAKLDAAKQLAADAAQLRDDAASTAQHALHEASDAGIKNKHWWEKAVDWVADHWDDIIAVCKVIVAVLGIVVLIIGGPLAWLVLAAAVLVLADTVMKYLQGKASLWDVLFAALDCIPMFKGLTTAGGLLKMARELPTVLKEARTLEGLANTLRKGGAEIRAAARRMAERRCKSDPIDVVSGDMVMSAVDVELPGVLPLVLERNHVSSYRQGRLFGRSWASTLDQRLLVDEQGVRFVTEDGTVLYYPVPAPGVPTLPAEGPRWPLTWDGQPGGHMSVARPDTGVALAFRALVDGPPTLLVLDVVTDPHGNRITFEYGAGGRLVEIRHNCGYHVGVETTQAVPHRITGLRLLSHPEHQLLVGYGYDHRGNLATVADALGRAARLAYDEHGRITSWKDRNGSSYRYVYDKEGRCVATDGDGGFLTSTFTYDPEHRRTSHQDSLGAVTVFHYNELLQVVCEVDPLGHATEFVWDRYDRPLSSTDPLGATTNRVWDGQGRLLRLTGPDGSATVAEYGLARYPVRVVEPGGAVWEFGYDDQGGILWSRDPMGAETRYTYDEHGHLRSIVDALGGERRIDTDPAGLPVVVTDATGATTRYVYDAFGRPVAITDPRGATERFGWTADGLMEWRRTPDGAEERWKYDADGNPTAHTDPTGARTEHRVTHFGLPTARIAADGSRLEFTHDTELRLTAVVNGPGQRWTYTYDAAGRLIEETDFDGRTLAYRYDAANRLLERIDAEGRVTHHVRDRSGNITATTHGSGITTDFSYDALHRVRYATNGTASVEFAYDLMGRVVAETINGRTVHSTYDLLGRKIERRTPAGVVSRWTYDAEDRPTALSRGRHTISFVHDGLGQETERRFGAVELSQTWDERRRLASRRISAPGVPTHTSAFDYRADDLLIGLRDSREGESRFGLDSMGRVTAVRARDWSEEYVYDAAGNITHDTKSPAPPTAGSREYRGGLLQRAGRTRFSRDASGRVIRRELRLLSGGSRVWEYGWTDGRLTSVTNPVGERWHYRYDAFDRRIAKERLGSDGSVVEALWFAWDGTDLAEEHHQGRGSTTTYEWSADTGLPVAQTTRASSEALSQEAVDERFFAIMTDLVGAPTELVSEDGVSAWRSRTDLWGAPISPTEPATTAVTCRLRFPGQYWDQESGLHYNYFRYYDPEVGRFLSPDPLGLDGGPNSNSYVPNPTEWIDPFGLALCRKVPRLEDGDLKQGWKHIDARHITGDHPTGPGHLMPPGTTREQVLKAASKAVRKGRRITPNPAKVMQTFEKKMTVNGFTATYRVSVDSTDGNRIVTFFPVGKSYK